MESKRAEERTGRSIPACEGCGMRAKEAGLLDSLWRITNRGNSAEVRQKDGRLIIYEVKKKIAAG